MKHTSARAVRIYSKIKARNEREEGMHWPTVTWDPNSSHALQNRSISDSCSSKLCFLTRSLKAVTGFGSDTTCSPALTAVLSTALLTSAHSSSHSPAGIHCLEGSREPLQNALPLGLTHHHGGCEVLPPFLAQLHWVKRTRREWQKDHL